MHRLALLVLMLIPSQALAFVSCVIGRDGRCNNNAVGSEARINPDQLSYDTGRDQLLIADADGRQIRSMRGADQLMQLHATTAALPVAVASDSNGRYYSTLDGGLFHIRNDGTWVPLPAPPAPDRAVGLAVCDGALWIAGGSVYTGANVASVWRLSPPFASATPQRMTTQGAMKKPRDVACYGGDLLIVDGDAHRIYRRSAAGTLTPFAGTGAPGFSGDGGKAVSAQLNYPRAVALDGATVYFTDSQNARVRRITPDGTITTVLGSGAVNTSNRCPSISDYPTEIPISTPGGIAIDALRRVLYVGSGSNGFVLGLTLDQPTPVPPTPISTNTLPPSTMTATAIRTATRTSMPCPPTGTPCVEG